MSEEENEEGQETNDIQQKIENALLQGWVGGRLDLLDPYHKMTMKADPYYFRWADAEDGAIVFFKPRVISMKLVNHWLQMPGVLDVQLHRQSMFAASMMGNKSDLQEVAILFEKV